MNLATVMAEIANRIDSIDGLRVHGFPADHVSPPAAVVTYPETYTFDETFGRGMDRITLPVVVLVGKVSDRASRDQLGPYVNGSGVSSIKAVVEGASLPAPYVRLPGGSGNYISTPDTAVLDLAQNLWLAVDMTLDDWSPATEMNLAGKYTTTGNQRAWQLAVAPSSTGVLEVRLSGDGATNTLLASGFNVANLAGGARQAIGIDVRPDNGAGQKFVQFYLAATLAGPWVPQGSPVTAATAISLFNSSAPFAVGATNAGTANVATGQFYGAEVRSGGQGGTIVTRPVVTSAGIVDSGGLTYTVHGTAALVVPPGSTPYTSFDSVRVTGAEFDIVQIAAVDYLAATFTLDIAGKGA